MTVKKAKSLGYTHHASVYGINGYFKTVQDEITAQNPDLIGISFRAHNWIFEQVVWILIWVFGVGRLTVYDKID